MLPGLNQSSSTRTKAAYPSLHIYLQQKYDKEGNALSAFENTASLTYFDIFSLWVAPMQLDVDEEFLVRVFRFVNSIVQVAAACTTIGCYSVL